MKKPRTSRPKQIKDRAAQTAQATSPDSALAAEAPKKKKGANPIEFMQQVRAEGRKVTWTSRKETWITAMMVFIMVAITMTFFSLLDMGLTAGMGGLLNLATPG